MDFEHQLPGLMQHAVDTLDPDPAPLVSGGLARGRRKRRRQQVARAAEGFTVVAVVGGIAAIVVSALPGRPATTQAPAGAAPATAIAARSTSATAPASKAVSPAVTPQQLQAIVLKLLPRKGVISHRSGQSDVGYVGTEFVYDDGHGKAMIDVAISYPPSGGGLGAGCQISICTTNPDGSHTAVYQGNGHPGHPGIPGQDWEVSLQRTDGVVVDVTEWNSAQEKDAPITRAEPPFSIAELKTIVASPTFTVHPN